MINVVIKFKFLVKDNSEFLETLSLQQTQYFDHQFLRDFKLAYFLN